MSRLSIWNSGIKGLDYKFIDADISEHFGISGTAVYCHLYEGVWDQSANGIANAAIMDGGIYSVQDPLFLENRERKYSDIVYELRGVYNVGDVEGDMRQFGLFLTNDTIFVEFHLNDMVAQLGRRLISGDVIEFPHQRDDTIPGDKPAMNKFYVIEDANRATNGYSSTWYPHIWRVKCTPMTASQEYQDILDDQATDPFGLNTGNTIGDLLGTLDNNLAINNAVVEAARSNFIHRNFETQHFWIKPGTETGDQNPFVWAGDGIPPNGYETLGFGTAFPQANVGDYFLRTDYSPATLFRRVTKGWEIQEINYRDREWTSAHRLLFDFLNNEKTTTFKDGEVRDQLVPLHKAVVKPKADF
jgi:hypothetical protein